jgi:hypothetical protein
MASKEPEVSDIPDIILDPQTNTKYKKGRFFGKVKKKQESSRVQQTINAVLVLIWLLPALAKKFFHLLRMYCCSLF